MTDIPTNYDPKTFEDKWYKFWQDNGFFNSLIDPQKEPYTILLPPPNCSGVLHLGHAINSTFQDILIRYKKLQGFNTLLIPGTDHGGISTQQMVCNSLMTNRGITKEQIGRTNFDLLIWKWKEEKAKIITDQIKKLGIAADWTKEQFTLSPKLSNWVNFVFKQLYDQDMIYRGAYIINYCTSCGTALANDEVDHIDQKGKLYYIKYFLEDSSDYITVATTRPETILGDVAIAHNPDDNRYTHLINKKVLVPFTGRLIPIIADTYVKPDFGTGLVKITPSHDKDDYEVGKRHNLIPIDIINKKGKMFNTKTEYDNLSTRECRELIIKNLESINQLEKVIDYDNKIGTCYRCKNNIETIISDQWFIKTEKLRDQALEFINDNKIRIVPEEHKAHLNKWLTADYDWCISRSIWWGHQIPIWYCQDCKHVNCGLTQINNCQKCKSNNLIRDPDVLDTWFSSALWAFSVFDSEQEFKYYFPSNVLVTGSDILFFWVARMMMMTSEVHKTIPFKDVFLHGIVRDKDGIKMSKTLGNGIDPMTIIEEHSADILRFGMMYNTHLGLDTNIGQESFEIGKTFCTKLWNSVRYILMNMNDCKFHSQHSLVNITPIDTWILNKLNLLINTYEKSLSNYDFGNAARILYSFVWDDFCNCYLECAKATIDNQNTKFILLKVIDTIVVMLHPYIPFLTEEIFQSIKMYITNYKYMKSIMMRKWPKLFEIKFDEEYNKLFEIHRDIVKNIRNVKASFEIYKHDPIPLILVSDDEKLKNYIQNTFIYIQKMCGISEITYELLPDKKYVIEKHNIYTLYFPINEKFKIDTIIKNLQGRITSNNLKISKLKETMDEKGASMGKKKILKFEQGIVLANKEISEIEEKIEYYKALVY